MLLGLASFVSSRTPKEYTHRARHPPPPSRRGGWVPFDRARTLTNFHVALRFPLIFCFPPVFRPLSSPRLALILGAVDAPSRELVPLASPLRAPQTRPERASLHHHVPHAVQRHQGPGHQTARETTRETARKRARIKRDDIRLGLAAGSGAGSRTNVPVEERGDVRIEHGGDVHLADRRQRRAKRRLHHVHEGSQVGRGFVVAQIKDGLLVEGFVVLGVVGTRRGWSDPIADGRGERDARRASDSLPTLSPRPP